jgi:maltose-binding protein MalE
VQKLLGILALGVAFALLISGTTGCNPPAKTEKAAEKTTEKAEKAGKTEKAEKAEKGGGDADKDKAEIKNKVDGEPKISKAAKSELKDVKIELMTKTKSDVKLTVAVKDDKGKASDKITGSGTIAKDADSGTITLVVGDAEAAPGVYDVEVTGDKTKGAAKFKLKVE